MNPSDLYFCVINGDNSYHEDPDWNIIIFCPIIDWVNRQCLPDYFFADKIKVRLPEDYVEYLYTEECCWASKKPSTEIIQDLTGLGLTECKPLEQFLIECWGYR
jgi:hypothetical protein